MIAVLDYEAGNLTSVELALRHVGGEPVVTQEASVVAQAERVVFPGVGSAKACMNNLHRLGLSDALREAIARGVPTLAICIGMQLLFERSDEDGGVECLGILPGTVQRFSFPDRRVKIPHMGWNGIDVQRGHPLLAHLNAGDECYFVHSYHCVAAQAADVVAKTDYEGAVFVSAVARDNLFATQFHPEKSGPVGLGILRSFLRWNPGGGA